jgi:DNA-binding LytR/AlgR family response regulator
MIIKRDYSCIVVDASKNTGALIEHKLKAFHCYKLIASFANAMDALIFLSRNDCDLIFLEIELPYIDGFQFLDILAKDGKMKPTIMMTASTAKYSEKAHIYYSKGLIDFISKSADAGRYAVSIERFEKQIIQVCASAREVSTVSDSITVLTSSKDIKTIYLRDILYFSHVKNYTNIHIMSGESYWQYISLKNMQLALPKDSCIQINRNCLVMLHQIANFDQNAVVLRKNKQGVEIKLPIYTTKREEILDELLRIFT